MSVASLVTLLALLATAAPRARAVPPHAPALGTRGVHIGTVADTLRAPATLAPLAFRKQVFATAKESPSPVAFAMDEQGAIWTANSLRYDGHGLFDNRLYPIVREDLTSRSVADRRRITEQWVRDGKLDTKQQKVTLDWLARYGEQVRRLRDTDGDGRADEVVIATDSLNDLVEGAAAGVLPWDGRIYSTIIPDLLVLTDSAGSGRWQRTVLQTGFGVHMGQGGHDMHGLVIGSDGRLWWSIADRGYDITTREGRHYAGHSGAVFRCWPDGSGLERWCEGLRNPQELAFDDHGDLFTGDNNADVGDRARLLYLPQGADAGWTFYLQYVRGTGAWTREHMWEKRTAPGDPSQPAWVLRPVDYLSTCPSGFTAYPGTGLPRRYDGSLWLVDYVSGLQTFWVEPRGAGFAMRDWHWGYRDSWGMCDADFGYDGKLWVLYWGESWHQNELSRLVTLTPPSEGVDTAAVAEVRVLFRGGFRALATPRLAALLGHADRRVRQRASFELVRRDARDALTFALANDPRVLARLHAIWGLGIVAHEHGGAAAAAPLLAALADTSAEVRRVAAFTLGDAGITSAGPALIAALRDSSSRVRFAAAQAIANLQYPANDELRAAIDENADRDELLRFAYVRALAVKTIDPLRLTGDVRVLNGSDAVRLASVLACRADSSAEVAQFLSDPDPQVATEAARAAYDLQQTSAMTMLARTLPGLRADLRTDPYVRRALHAALRVGRTAQADQVAAFAADSTTSDAWREEALRVLAQWDKPDERDGVLSRWLPLPPRTPGAADSVLAASLPAILARAHGDGLALAVALARRANVVIGNGVLAGWVADESQDEHARIDALRWLDARRAPEASAALAAALGGRSDSLFLAGFSLALGRDASRAVAAATHAYASTTTPLRVRQAAVRALGPLAAPEAVAFLSARFAELRAGTLPAALRLDVLDAARLSPAPALVAAVRAWDAGLDRRDPLAAWRAALQGGDPAHGKAIFEGHPAVQCIRCHTIDGAGGTTGPDLSRVGTRERGYLLQSMIDPNAAFAPGYETTTLTLVDGSTVTGQVRHEDARQIVLLVDGQPKTFPRAQVRARPRGMSLMPPIRDLLQPFEIRDVLAYLTTRRDVTPDVALGTLVPRVATTGAGTVGTNVNALGRPLHAGGAACAHGIGVHAPSRLVYAVPAGASAFVARAGVDDGAPGGQVGFEVRVDGRSAWKSGPLKLGQLAHVWAELPAGAREVELLVDDGGNGVANDVADWLDAGFVRAAPSR